MRRRKFIALLGSAGVAWPLAAHGQQQLPVIGFLRSTPGANVTGVSFLAIELGPKRLDLLRQLVPNATTIAMLVNPGSPDTEAERRDVQAAAQAISATHHSRRHQRARNRECVYSVNATQSWRAGRW